MFKKDKVYTDMQKAFLIEMSDPSNFGDIRTCMTKAGYGPKTPLVTVTNPLREELVDVAKDLLGAHSVKATISLFSVLDDPAKLGAANLLKAAKEILDRSNVQAQEQNLNIKVGDGIVILPAKNTKVENDQVDSQT